MRTPEYGEVGPETRRTLDIMEDEYREKMGLPPRHSHEVYDRNMEVVPSDAMVALRKEWAGRNDR